MEFVIAIGPSLNSNVSLDDDRGFIGRGWARRL